jgi:predicted kinase
VPVEVCLERNLRRNRVVPEEAVRKMAAKMAPPRREEGFSRVTVVRE